MWCAALFICGRFIHISFSVICWRLTNYFVKNFGEIKRVIISYRICNDTYGHCGIVMEQAAGLLYSHLRLIFRRGNRVFLHKNSIQMAWRDANIFCNIVDCTSRRSIGFHKRNCFFQINIPFALVICARGGAIYFWKEASTNRAKK